MLLIAARAAPSTSTARSRSRMCAVMISACLLPTESSSGTFGRITSTACRKSGREYMSKRGTSTRTARRCMLNGEPPFGFSLRQGYASNELLDYQTFDAIDLVLWRADDEDGPKPVSPRIQVLPLCGQALLADSR